MSEKTIELELTAMAHGGSALGRHDKQTIFVPYTIPGEVIEARIVTDKGRIAFGEGVRILDASADRVYPRCPHFGPKRCGRCQWQHIDYRAQTLLKQDVLADQLARIGKFDDATIEAALHDIIPSPVQWGYAYHITFKTTPEGKLGFTPLSGNDGVIVIDECHIIHPALLDLFHQLDLDFKGINRVKFQLGTDDNHMLVMYINDEADMPELHTDMPGSINVILPDNEPINLIGDTHVRYQVGTRTFRVTAGSDFRANVAMLERLAGLVMDAVGDADTVLDLYGGVGFFSAFIADRADLVTLVESFPPAATDADDNLSDFDHIDVIEGNVEDVLPALEETYAAAVLDPPSDGLSIDVIDALGESRIPRLVYVSNDPATLARDGARLVGHGYRMVSVQPIDLHPQTFYVDSIAVFVQNDL